MVCILSAGTIPASLPPPPGAFPPPPPPHAQPTQPAPWLGNIKNLTLLLYYTHWDILLLLYPSIA